MIDLKNPPGHQRKLAETWLFDEHLVHARAPESHLNHAHQSAVSHIAKALEFLPEGRRRVAVQAGGHIGMWPLILSGHFEVVYTFEPDADNFRCLAHNAPYWNVYPFRACLGRSSGWCELRYTGMSGSNQLQSREGRTPVMTLDQLGLLHLDLLALDVEGYETGVYCGGEETITRCSPVILCEETGKEAADDSGYNVRTAHRWLAVRGYQRKARVDKDGVWARS